MARNSPTNSRAVAADRWRMPALAGAACGLLLCAASRAGTNPTWPEIKLTAQDRVLILAPHPDDEVIGCAGIIQEAVAKKLPVRILYLTYGDQNQWSFMLYRKRPVLMPAAVRSMGVVRHDEALVAAKTLGVSPQNLTFLGYPDFGTLAMWHQHWDDRPPMHGLLTRVAAVPYATAFRPGAPYKGEDVLQDITRVLREFRPTKIFVSHPSDYNGDHRALYLFTRVALWDLGEELKPELYPYLVHYRHWPSPRAYRPTESLEPPPVLREQIPWRIHRLSQKELDCGLTALKAHRTQYGYSAKYLLSFVRSDELFGDFPDVVLTADSPHKSLAGNGGEIDQDPPEELNDTERAAFVGLERRFVRIEGHDLLISVTLSRPLEEGVQASVYIFGYRSDRPFAEMPKIHVKLGELAYALFDQDQRLARESIQVTRDQQQIVIRLPLELLGNPQRALTSARTYLGDVPLDAVSWRILEFPPAD